MDYERTDKEIEHCWKELNYAIKKLFKKEYGGYSKEINVRFLKDDDRKNPGNEISIFSDNKDFRNRYKIGDYPKDEKGEDYWCWEIFLNKDGTWTIK